MVFIVGIGPGSKEHITYKATDVLENSDIIIGFKRAIESLYFIENEKKEVNSLKEIIEYINNNTYKNIAIAASGDPCYYGITNYIKNNYKGRIEIIPGISSFQYMMSKIGMPWNQAFTGSMHGREDDFIGKVEKYKTCIWLTDKKNTPNVLCKKLMEKGINAVIYVGENLSYNDEKITWGTVTEMIDNKYSDLCVVVIENVLYKG